MLKIPEGPRRNFKFCKVSPAQASLVLTCSISYQVRTGLHRIQYTVAGLE